MDGWLMSQPNILINKWSWSCVSQRIKPLPVYIIHTLVSVYCCDSRIDDIESMFATVLLFECFGWNSNLNFSLGQKTVLTNVQEELDRMTRKPDSMVTTNSSPTENEAWLMLEPAYVNDQITMYIDLIRPGVLCYGRCYKFFLGQGEMKFNLHWLVPVSSAHSGRFAYKIPLF